MGADLCAGLSHAHTLKDAGGQELGLVHRDVKLSNVIFIGGVPKLADIGLVTDSAATRSLTRSFFDFSAKVGQSDAPSSLMILILRLYRLSMKKIKLRR